MSKLTFTYVSSFSRADCVSETTKATLTARSMETRFDQVRPKTTLV